MPSTIARPCSSAARPFSSTTQATDVPADLERAGGHASGGGAQAVGVERLAAEAHGAHTRGGEPAVRVQERDASFLPAELSGVDELGQTALDQPVQPLRGSGERDGILNGEDEDVGLDPSGWRLDDVDLHERRRMLSENRSNGGAPFEGSALRRRHPIQRGRESAASPSPPSPHPPLRGRIPLPIEALLLGGLPRAG